jgi:glycoside/pentoside/hexuronide:cation symporter, GPH family
MTDSVAVPSATAAELRRKPLGLGLMAVYGSGNIADAVFQAALGYFLFFYLTAVCGMPNSLAGLSLFGALIVDSLIDPLVGSISDNSWTRWGRRHPFMFGGAVPLAVGLGLLFSVPSGLSGASLFAYVMLVSIVMRISHSFYFLPYVGLGAELSDDYAERTNIVASRFLLGVVGTGAAIGLGYGVFMRGEGGLLHRGAYAPFGWACGAVALAAALYCAWGTLRTLPRLHRVAPSTGSLATRFFRDIGEIFRNRSFVILFSSLVLFFVGAGTAVTLFQHVATFFWKLPGWVIGLVAFSAPVGLLIGVPVSVFLSNRFEKRSVVIACFTVFIAYHAIVPLLRIVGVLPAAGPVLYAILLGLAVLIGAVAGCAGIGFQSMMADAADEHEFLFGTRREALYYAGLNFSAKAASGVGVLLAGVGLDLIHFPTNLAARAAAGIHIPAETLRNLGLIYGLGVAAIYALGALIFLAYRLDRPRYAKIQQALDERRRAAGLPPDPGDLAASTAR